MTGIERLRELTWNVTDLGGRRFKGGFIVTTVEDIDAIADQIDRERACDVDTVENVRLIVGAVLSDMERHVSGVEGAEDSPVARWAREMRDALKSDTSDGRDAQKPSWHDLAEDAGVTSEAAKVTRDPAEDVSMSAYDLLPQDERDAIAWVREHGGLEEVKAHWDGRVPLASVKKMVELHKSKRERLKAHALWLERKCHERRERIVRCRDCKHAIMSYQDGYPRCAGPMVAEATLVDPDGFCAWGEERDA